MRKYFIDLLVVATIPLISTIASQRPAAALSGLSTHDSPWNSDHIDHLPVDIRKAVLRTCGGHAHALHYFATYLNGSATVRLHFENLRCDGEQSVQRSDNCLREEYAVSGEHYRLVKRYHAACSF